MLTSRAGKRAWVLVPFQQNVVAIGSLVRGCVGPGEVSKAGTKQWHAFPVPCICLFAGCSSSLIVEVPKGRGMEGLFIVADRVRRSESVSASVVSRS